LVRLGHILHFNLTEHSTSAWIAQQIRETFPDQAGVRYLILDHDTNYGLEVPTAIRAMGIVPLHTALHAVRGRMEWPSAGSEAAAATCSTT
jgi:hypothetical protein